MLIKGGFCNFTTLANLLLYTLCHDGNLPILLQILKSLYVYNEPEIDST